MQRGDGDVLSIAAGDGGEEIGIGGAECQGCRSGQGGRGHVVGEYGGRIDGHQAGAGDRQGVDRGEIGRQRFGRCGIQLGGAGHAGVYTAEVCRQGAFQRRDRDGTIAGNGRTADGDAIGLGSGEG